jgi:hypothetical protein
MQKSELEIGGKYNWVYQPERLIYMGYNWSCNGYWHQFALVEKPTEVWCEVQDSDISSFEKSKKPETVYVDDSFAVAKHKLKQIIDDFSLYTEDYSYFVPKRKTAQWKSEVYPYRSR